MERQEDEGGTGPDNGIKSEHIPMLPTLSKDDSNSNVLYKGPKEITLQIGGNSDDIVNCMKILLYRHSLEDCGSSQLYLYVCLSVCVSVCVSVCPAFTAYISVTMGWILIKLGGNVGTLVRLIVLKFEHSAAKGNTTHKG